MRISDWSSDVCSSDLRILGTQFAAFGAGGGFAALQRLGRAVLQLFAQFFVETLDTRQFLQRNIGDFRQLAEAFGDQQLRKRLVAVQPFLDSLAHSTTSRLRLPLAWASGLISNRLPRSSLTRQTFWTTRRMGRLGWVCGHGAYIRAVS